MEKINPETAKSDIQNWLDHKRVSNSKRESKQEFIETLEDEVREGNLVLTDGYHLEYILKVPIENKDGEVTVEKLLFKPRLKVAEAERYLKNVKADNADRS